MRWHSSNYHFCLVHLGEWGAALREIDATVTMLDRNGDYYRAQLARLIRAALHLHAMDFAGARDLCESIVPLARDPLPRGAPNAPPAHPLQFHWALIVSGNAETALARQSPACRGESPPRDHLARSKRDISRRPPTFRCNARACCCVRQVSRLT
jgi:hypothetical protein